ncbi:MAG: zinc ribbon domain-containing protein [Acidimicrobiales bacterium]
MSDASLVRLLAVQDLDTQITQLAHRRVVLADRVGLTGFEADLAAKGAEEAVLLEQRGALAATQKELEAQIAAIDERSSGIERRMYAARGSSTRDLQAMDDEVRHLNQRRGELEDEELVAMVDQEPIDAALAELAVVTVPLRERVAALRSEVAQGQAAIDGELATATAARAAEAAQLPPALYDRYEALRIRLKGTGAARLIGHHCDGCHLELSAAEVERIRATTPDTVVTCDQCGRILVPT